MKTYGKVPGGWVYLFILWKGTLIITITLLTLGWGGFGFFIFAVTLRFLRGNKSAVSVTTENDFFSQFAALL